MIEADRRKAIYLLHKEGVSERELERMLNISRNTIRSIIAQNGEMPVIERKKQVIEEGLLRELHDRCEGYIQRMHEILTEDKAIDVKYSTLTRILRELGISKSTKKRCDQKPDKPGEEMQHDTTVYHRQVGGRKIKIVASLLYMRYSKRRYLKFYRSFNRFRMKCFFHEALMFWGYSAGDCVIDNTNLARLYGTGADAVIVPEMVTFAKRYGFKFICHEKGHANRKAGEERSFWTVETNFLPGRTFQSMEDLNEQALEWATVRMENKPQSKAGLIPAKAFEFECNYLTKLPVHLPAPYQPHMRIIDQYGYSAFNANYYWVPGTGRGNVKILEYADRIKICKNGKCELEYLLPAEAVRNKKFAPEGCPPPRYQPKSRKKPTQEEEKRLRCMAESVNAYMDYIVEKKTKGQQYHNFIRKLFSLCRKVREEIFIDSIERAHKYRITDISTIERIASLKIGQESLIIPSPEIDQNYRQRQAYQDGRLTDAPDLSKYTQEDDHE